MDRKPPHLDSSESDGARFGLSGASWLSLFFQGVVIGVSPAIFSASHLESYGLGIFVFGPALTAFIGGLAARWGGARHRAEPYVAAVGGMMLAGFIMLVSGVEGAICLLMATPLLIVMALAGAALSSVISSGWLSVMVCGGAGAGALTADSVLQAQQGRGNVSHVTVGVVRGTPEDVWPLVVQQGELSPPSFWMFKMGVAHPVRTLCDAESVGTARQCVLSTGVIEETVTESRPGQVFEFEAHSTPPSMVEFNPFHSEVAAGHLHNYIEMHRGRFELRALPGGRTEIRCTSWYTNRFAPLAYWRLWSDEIVRQVHLQVLTDIDRRVSSRG